MAYGFDLRVVPFLSLAAACWLPGAFAYPQDEAELRRQYAIAWAKTVDQPIEERRAMLAPLFESVREISPPRYPLLCDMAERMRDQAQRVSLARQWVAAEPNHLRARAELAAALTETDQMAERSEALAELMAMVKTADDLDEFLGAINWCLERNADAVASKLIVAGMMRSDSGSVDLWTWSSLALRFCRNVESRLAAHDAVDDEMAELSRLTQDAIESVVNLEVAQGQVLHQHEVIETQFMTYCYALSVSKDVARASAFLNRLTQTVQQATWPEEDKAICLAYLEPWQSVFLWHAGDRHEAFLRTFATLDRSLERFQNDGKRHFGEVMIALANCLRTADSASLPVVLKHYEDDAFGSLSQVHRYMTIADTDDEAQRDLVKENQALWISGIEALCRRYIEERDYLRAKSAASRLSELLLWHSDGAPLFALDDETRRSVVQFSRFVSTLVEAHLQDHGSPLMNRFELSRETWFNSQPKSIEELRGRVVLLGLCCGGKRPEIDRPRSTYETKLLIDHHLSDDGLDGMGPDLISDSIMGYLHHDFPTSDLGVLCLVDDDYSSSMGNGDPIDDWHPAPPGSLAPSIRSLGIVHPVVYSSESKFIDALVCDGVPRVLVFDRAGHLVTWIESPLVYRRFESLPATVRDLLESRQP